MRRVGGRDTSWAAGRQPAERAAGDVPAGREEPKNQLELTDIQPLNDSDSNGSNSMYAAMAWIMAGFLIMAVLRGGAPEIKRLRKLLPMLGGWAVGMAVWLWFPFDVLIGAINGHGWAMIGFGALTIFSVALFTGVFTRTLGIAGVVPVLVIALMVGVPASGGGISLYMVPEIFRDLHDVLPLPAAVDVVRATVYFDHTGIVGHLATIAAWGAVSLLLHVGIDWAIARRDRSANGRDGANGQTAADGGSGTPALGSHAERPAPVGATTGTAAETASRTGALRRRRRS